MNATLSSSTPKALAPSPCHPDIEAGLFDAHARDEQDALPAPDSGSADGLKAAAATLRPAAVPAIPEGRLIEWIDGIAEHDERALVALYDATLSRVYSIVLRIVRRPALADEVVEDTYFQVWRQAVRFDAARGRVLTWLLGMARSRAIDAIRGEARFQHDSLDLDSAPDVADDTPAADDLLDAARGHADLHRALMLLNAQPRQLVALAFFRGLSHEEIATQTALPLGTVKAQIRRALVTLRQVLCDSRLDALAP